MAKVVIKILQGSADTQTVLGGLTVYPLVEYTPWVKKETTFIFTFWPTLYIAMRQMRLCSLYMMCAEKTCPDAVGDVGIHWPVMLAGYIAVHRCPPGMTGWHSGSRL